MKMRYLLLLAMVALALPGRAQQPKREIVAEGGKPDDRASTRVLYWDTKRDGSAGQLAIDYGRPVWKKDYEDPGKFDAMTKGKVWRMGSNFWTLLDTSLPLKISGKAVPAGYYFVALRRSADGAQWSLAFIDPAKVRAARLDGFEIQKAKVEFEAPVKVEKASAITEKLTITLSYPEDAPTKVAMKVAWGNFLVTAPIEVTLVK
jgi:hypothetical protein